MTQVLFASATAPLETDLDANFTNLFDLREQISTNSYTGSIPKLTISSAGNIGVGIVPSAWASSKFAIESVGYSLWTSASSNFLLGNNVYQNSGLAYIYKNTAAATAYYQNSGAHTWLTAGSGTAGSAISWTTPMTLDVSGNLLLGVSTYANQNANGYMIGSGITYTLHPSGTGSGSGYSAFSYNGVTIGSVTQSGTTGVAYNTTSDYRLKDVTGPLAGSGAFIDALRPCAWSWKADGSIGVGFIAHELQAVSPSSVTGTKDAVDAEGKPVYQAVGYGSPEMVAMLVAELQSVRARLAALEAR